jgi:hypothetical protein
MAKRAVDIRFARNLPFAGDEKSFSRAKKPENLSIHKYYNTKQL